MAQDDHNNTPRPVCLITGAGSGIGSETARLLGAAGYRVALAGRTGSKLIAVGREIGERAEDWIDLQADVSAVDQAAALVDRTVDAFGRIDAVVNNAGASPLKPVDEHDDADVDAIFAVNTLGPIATIRRAIPVLLDHAGGVIVTTSSMASADPFPGLGVYGAAKAAMNTLTRAIANEYGDRGLRAYAVAPGAVETPLLRSLFDAKTLPAENCLAPRDVARVIAGCVTGETEAKNGDTVWLPSP
jgi:NAD(P)-dependent dehydrogenase (short-subunit alcohol dehydrogenase family)